MPDARTTPSHSMLIVPVQFNSPHSPCPSDSMLRKEATHGMDTFTGLGNKEDISDFNIEFGGEGASSMGERKDSRLIEYLALVWAQQRKIFFV